MITLNHESYNKIAEKWNEHRSASPVNKCIVYFCQKLKPGGKILDIGCGTGYPIDAYLCEKGFSVTGVDICENLLQMAKSQKIPNAEFILCDFFEFQPATRYDGIIAFDSFFHFPKEKQETIYQKISAWMNPGAYLLFTHGNKEGEITGTMFDEEFYYSALDTDDVHRLLQTAGFEIELSVENYVEGNSDRGLLIVAKKIYL